MVMNQYDIVVVGAGPAGAAAAQMAAERGLKTVILEEHRVIGIPVHCSGFISPAASQRDDGYETGAQYLPDYCHSPL